jgi:hypothetical protein
MVPMILPLGHRSGGVGAVCLAAWIVAGTLPGQTAPGDNPDKRREVPGQAAKRVGADFDPNVACDLVVQAHNRIRAAAKRPALAVSPRLQAAAQRHATDMAARGEMTHKGGDGSTAIVRIKDTGYPYRRAGENIAAGCFTTDALMQGWMDSPPHKRNILGSYSQIGVACATAENGKRYWCVTFGLPMRR